MAKIKADIACMTLYMCISAFYFKRFGMVMKLL